MCPRDDGGTARHLERIEALQAAEKEIWSVARTVKDFLGFMRLVITAFT